MQTAGRVDPTSHICTKHHQNSIDKYSGTPYVSMPGGVRMYILYFDDACIPGGADLYDLFCDCHATLQIFTMTFHALAGVLNSFATLTLKQQDSEEKRDSAWQRHPWVSWDIGVRDLEKIGAFGCFWCKLWTTWVKWLQNGCKTAVHSICEPRLRRFVWHVPCSSAAGIGVGVWVLARCVGLWLLSDGHACPCHV